jgi:hypothetical protein
MGTTPPILLEACNAMEPAAKRLECLRAANGTGAPTAATDSGSRAAAPQSIYSPSNSASKATSTSAQAAPAPGSSYTVGGKTCYVGPRGGTYTITASGRKNYSGC